MAFVNCHLVLLNSNIQRSSGHTNIRFVAVNTSNLVYCEPLGALAQANRLADQTKTWDGGFLDGCDVAESGEFTIYELYLFIQIVINNNVFNIIINRV